MTDRVLPSQPFTTPMPKVQPPKASHADRVEEAVRYAREGGAGFDTDVERNIAELGARRAISMFSREEGFYDPSFASSAPYTITLSRDQLTTALREAAAFGTDLSSCSSTTAGAVREVADLVLDAVVAGRPIGDEYDTLLDAEKRIAR